MMIEDPFKSYSPGPTDPVSNAVAITPSDTEDLAVIPRGIIVSETGHVRATFLNGETVDLYVVAGVFIPVRVKKIHASGTSAIGIVAAW